MAVPNKLPPITKDEVMDCAGMLADTFPCTLGYLGLEIFHCYATCSRHATIYVMQFVRPERDAKMTCATCAKNGSLSVCPITSVEPHVWGQRIGDYDPNEAF